MSALHPVDAEPVAAQIADRVVKSDVLVTAIKSAVRSKIDEAFKGETFANAVGNIVEQKVSRIFDNHMGELKEELRKINGSPRRPRKHVPPLTLTHVNTALSPAHLGGRFYFAFRPQKAYFFSRYNIPLCCKYY